jgi:hypothetical protein
MNKQQQPLMVRSRAETVWHLLVTIPPASIKCHSGNCVANGAIPVLQMVPLPTPLLRN